MTNFIAAFLVLFASTQIAVSNERDVELEERLDRRADRFDMDCVVVELGDVDKVLRCENFEVICYADSNDLSCIRKGKGGRDY